MRIAATELSTRVGISASLAISGIVHAYLYVDSYRYVPMIGASFLLQASVSCALGVLILVGGPGWLRVVAAALAVGALVGFGLSRTVGVFGFIEIGWDPAPYAAVSVIAEIVTLVLCAVWWIAARRERLAQRSPVLSTLPV
ncbi:hypothetical protein [Mycolicibacterium hodleri]|uniref:DUF4345 domain-containing protein n=1 Tax=Mycolicibacterium hodleri TaxID=49897 RepID=A0A502DRZ5_9MYCO|nr:hypothetical protein [Mycolicibacterium hodleri]TPG28143.1 hypothetical protein EAH80_27830 [Mycolicibacterium hodleri]